MSKVIAKKYAIALFEVSRSEDKVESILHELESIAQYIKEDKKFAYIILNASIPQNMKKPYIDNLLKKDKFSKIIENFLNVLIQNRRISFIIQMIDFYREAAMKYSNSVRITIITAYTLNKTQSNELIKVLKEKMQKNIILESAVDPSLIDGIVLRYDSKMIDLSISHYLHGLENHLLQS